MKPRKIEKKSSPVPKKLCKGKCGKEKPESTFYKVDSPLFPDGRLDICRDCVRESIDYENLEEVIGFLRQIDKPFYQEEWDKVMKNKAKRNPIGSYLSMVGSLHQYKGKTFMNSDGIQDSGNVDLSSVNPPSTIETTTGKIIEYSDEMVDKWGTGYNQKEYLQLEKFYQDMRSTHEIHTPTHIDMLMQLAYLSVDRDRLRRGKEWTDYSKISKTYEDMMKSAGFRPVDRKGIDDATGIRSFSQIWEEVEKRGWRQPPPVEFERDIVDGMMIALSNYYHRLVGKEILRDIPEEMKDELEEFYKEDLTPVEIDEDYEDELGLNELDEDGDLDG